MFAAIPHSEFDYGDRVLANFLRELNSHTECPKTPVVAANIVPGENSPLMSLVDDGTITSSITKTLPDGKTVGIIGIDIKAKVRSDLTSTVSYHIINSLSQITT